MAIEFYFLYIILLTMPSCCCLASLSLDSKISLIIIITIILPVELIFAICGLIPIAIGNYSVISMIILITSSFAATISIISMWSIIAFDTEQNKNYCGAISFTVLLFTSLINVVASVIWFIIISSDFAETHKLKSVPEYVFTGIITGIVGICILVALVALLAWCSYASYINIKARSDKYHEIQLKYCQESETMI